MNLHTEITLESIEQELRGSYLDYAMSVIVGRALCDIKCSCCPYSTGRGIIKSLRSANYICTCDEKKLKSSSYLIFLALVKVSFITYFISKETNIPINHMNASVMFMSSAMVWASFVHHKSRIK